MVGTKNSSIIALAFAQTVTCENLYTLLKQELGTSKVSVFVQGVFTDGTHAGNRAYVPDTPEPLSIYSPKGYDKLLVEVDYTESQLKPDKLMTRGEFVIELLDIWETMRERLSPLRVPRLTQELDLVIEYTKNVYSVNELADLKYLEEHPSSLREIMKVLTVT